MSDFDVKTTKRYQDAVQNRDWQTCDLMFKEFEFLQKRIDELESLLREACEVIDRSRRECEQFYSKSELSASIYSINEDDTDLWYARDISDLFLDKPEIRDILKGGENARYNNV